MASEKKPSIYSDRSTIGSSDELDEYGVWVKSEPQDLSSVSTKSPSLDESSLPDIDAGLEDTSFESETEFGEIDLPDLDLPDENGDLSVSIEEKSTEIDESFDSFGSDAFDSLGEPGLDEASLDESGLDETSLDIPGLEEDGLGEPSLDDANFDDFSIPDDNTGDFSIPADDTGNDDFSIDGSISLDDGLTAESDQKEGTELDDDLNIEISEDIEIDEAAFGEDATFEDTPFDDTPVEQDVSFETEGFTEVPVDEFIDESPDELPEASPDFDIASHAQELASSQHQSDLSTQLLMKIAEELSSIRNELSSLKKEFAGIKSEEPEDKEEAPHGGFFNEEEDEKIALTGDELDNILNTADFTEEAGEDATEELEEEFPYGEAEDSVSSDPFQVSEEAPGENLDAGSLPEMLSDQEDIISTDTHDAIAEESDNFELSKTDDFTEDFDSIDIEDAAISDDLAVTENTELTFERTVAGDADFHDNLNAFDEALDSGELKQILIEGIEPMTSAPEDTSYLEDEIVEDSSDDGIETDDALHDIPMDALPDEDAVEALDDIAVISDEFLNDTAESADAAEADVAEADVAEVDVAEADAAEADVVEADAFENLPLDLSDAVIDEPDLSDQIVENPVEEPSLDDITIDLDLDLDAAEEDSLSEDSLPEDSLPEDSISSVSFGEAEELDQVIPEGFVVDTDFEHIEEDADDVDIEHEIEDEIEEVDLLDEIDPVLSDDLSSVDSLETLEVATEADQTEEAEEITEFSDGIPAEASEEKSGIPSGIRGELKIVLSYMDQLLESLPEDKIEEFAKSQYFDTYKKLFKELGLA